jgi:hypothetical protein
MSAVFAAPGLAGASWFSFQIHPVLSIVLGLASVAAALFALSELRECARLFELIDAEDLRATCWGLPENAALSGGDRGRHSEPR